MAAYQAKDRRPIASRERPFWKATASFLVRRHASANGISLFGMFSGIAAGILFAATPFIPSPFERVAFAAAALCIQLRLICNMLDGMVALESHTASPVGELYNELPDRISDAATLIGAGYTFGCDPILGYLAAIVAILVAYVRSVGKGAGTPSFFTGPMAKQQRMFVLTLAAGFMTVFPHTLQIPWQGRTWSAIAMALIIIILLGLFTAVRRVHLIAVALKTNQGRK